jgi:hypothetical protein
MGPAQQGPVTLRRGRKLCGGQVPPQLIDRAGDMDVAVRVDTNDDPCRLRLCHGGDGRLPSGRADGYAGRAGGQHRDESVATGSCQVTSARLVLAWTMTAARVDRSRQRHQASETTGQTRTTATTGIIAVKQVRPPHHQQKCCDGALALRLVSLDIGCCSLVAGRSPPVRRLPDKVAACP